MSTSECHAQRDDNRKIVVVRGRIFGYWGMPDELSVLVWEVQQLPAWWGLRTGLKTTRC